MGSEGWIKLHRKVVDCWIWNEKPFDKGRAWIDLLLLAMHHDKKILVDNKIVTISRGSFMTSTVKLSARWGWSRNKVNRYLELLENEQMLSTEKTARGTLINIVNYSDYQGFESYDETGNETTNETANETANETSGETGNETQNKNIKNEKNIKNIVISNDITCRTKNVQRIVEEWNTLTEYGIKSISKLSNTSKRYQCLIARINEYSVDEIIQAIDNIRHSSFLQGKIKSRRKWTITFDWFVLPNNFPKVLEGQYTDDGDSKNIGKEWRGWEDE